MIYYPKASQENINTSIDIDECEQTKALIDEFVDFVINAYKKLSMCLEEQLSNVGITLTPEGYKYSTEYEEFYISFEETRTDSYKYTAIQKKKTSKQVPARNIANYGVSPSDNIANFIFLTDPEMAEEFRFFTNEPEQSNQATYPYLALMTPSQKEYVAYDKGLNAYIKKQRTLPSTTSNSNINILSVTITTYPGFDIARQKTKEKLTNIKNIWTDQLNQLQHIVR